MIVDSRNLHPIAKHLNKDERAELKELKSEAVNGSSEEVDGAIASLLGVYNAAAERMAPSSRAAKSEKEAESATKLAAAFEIIGKYVPDKAGVTGVKGQRNGAFTAESIAAMSDDEYNKNQKAILAAAAAELK